MSKHFAKETERDFFEHLNEKTEEKARAAQLAEEYERAWKKAVAHAEQQRKKRLTLAVAHSLLPVAVMAALYGAETSGLISSVLTNPAYVVSLIWFGWQLSKIEKLVKAK